MTVTCTLCGHKAQMKTDPALAVACPTCYTPPGSKCRRPSGYTIPGRHQVHADRDLAALRAGCYPAHPCPTRPPALAYPQTGGLIPSRGRL